MIASILIVPNLKYYGKLAVKKNAAIYAVLSIPPIVCELGDFNLKNSIAIDNVLTLVCAEVMKL